MINNDRWSALSMKDRAALIDIYVKSGITDLGEIRKDYNSFDYGGDTESPVDMGELEASFINPKQSRVNRRREVRRAFKSIKNLIKSNEIDSQDILNAYNGLNENQRKRALESAMKFSPLAQPDGVLNVVKHHVLRKPRQAFKTLRYIMTGKGKPSLFAVGYDKGYNGLWHDSEGFSNGIIDALIYGNTIDPRIGTQTNKEDFGPELDYIRKNYKNKDIQYIQTNPGVTINQQNITPTSYVGSSGSFNTSMPGVSINNQGFILEKGTRNDSTFVRGLDVYDFKADDYSKKWDTENMYPVIQQIDTDTNPVAIKTPWVPEEEINTILSDSEGYSPYRKFGGKLNKFATGGPTGEGTATYNHPRYNHNEETDIYSYLRERGVPHTQASAIMGNIAVESMLDPHITQIGGGGGYGLIQTTDQPRKNNFINYDGQPYEFGSKLDPETQRQLDYIIDKGLNTYSIGEWRKVGKSGARNVRKEFLKETDINKASDLFTKGYLRPGKPHTKRRQSMSTFYNEKYKNPFEVEILFK